MYGALDKFHYALDGRHVDVYVDNEAVVRPGSSETLRRGKPLSPPQGLVRARGWGASQDSPSTDEILPAEINHTPQRHGRYRAPINPGPRPQRLSSNASSSIKPKPHRPATTGSSTPPKRCSGGG